MKEKGKLKVLTFLMISLMLLAQLWSKGYDSFYLGLNPTQKIEAIKTFLSEEGKITRISVDTIFVKDNAEVLAKIKKFLSKDIALSTTQIRVSLKNLNQRQQRGVDSSIGFKYSDKKGGSIKWQGGASSSQSSQSQVTQIMTTSGGTAEISLFKSREQLELYRMRFLKVAVLKNVREGVALLVKPVLSGRMVHVDLKSVYWSYVEGKKRVFETGEIKTRVVTVPGRWLSVGGGTSHNSKKRRTNVFQGIQSSSSSGSRNIDIKTEVVKPLVKPADD